MSAQQGMLPGLGPSRLGCVDLASFPLQLVGRQHPDWRDEPLVVVEDDRPLAPILFTNKAARALGIHRGMKFSNAQALNATLRGVVVPPEDIETGLQEIHQWLLAFSPFVEVGRERLGVFWLDPSGLQNLFVSPQAWGEALVAKLADEGLSASAMVGFSRGPLLAASRMVKGAWVFESPAEEAKVAAEVPIDRLELAPKAAEQLRLLGIETIGHFVALPYGQLRQRYGDEVASLHRFLAGQSWAPLQGQLPVLPHVHEQQVEPATHDTYRLLFLLKQSVQALLEHLSQGCERLVGLQIRFKVAYGSWLEERLEPAQPTLELSQLTELIRLRLDAMTLPGPVEELQVEAESVRAEAQQPSLLAKKERRDRTAGARALARVKALYGESAVSCAVLTEGHLPEAQFRWQPIEEVPAPAQQWEQNPTPLLRLIWPRPLPLPDIPLHEPEAWLGSHGAVLKMQGPYRVSGGWWHKRVTRDYHYIETQNGEILWTYFDHHRRRWFWHGSVE